MIQNCALLRIDHIHTLVVCLGATSMEFFAVVIAICNIFILLNHDHGMMKPGSICWYCFTLSFYYTLLFLSL